MERRKDRADRRPSRGVRGASLLEVTVSMALLSLLGGGVFSMMLDSEGVFRSSLRSSALQQSAVDAMRTLRRDVKQASAATLTIDAQSDPNGDILELQVAVGMTGTTVDWGALTGPPEQPLKLLDHRIRYQVTAVQGGRLELIRRILDPTGNPVAPDEVLASDVDVPGAAGKGFQVSESGGFVTLALRVKSPVSGQAGRTDITRSQSTLVRLRP